MCINMSFILLFKNILYSGGCMKKKIYIFLTLLTVVVTIVYSLVQHYVSPIIYEYGDIEVKRFLSAIVNTSLSEDIIELIDKDIITVERDHTGDISAVNFEMALVNTISNRIAAHVQNLLIKVEEGTIEEFDISNNNLNYKITDLKKGIVAKIPMGVALKNPLFADVGPDIPVRYQLIGSVDCDVKTDIKDYGINHVMAEIYIIIEVKMRVFIPGLSQEITAYSKVPLASRLIKGAVPYYYYTNGNKVS